VSTGRRRRWTDSCPGSDEPQRRYLRRGVDARCSPPTVRRAIASMPARDRGCHRPVRHCCGIVRWKTPDRRVAITGSTSARSQSPWWRSQPPANLGVSLLGGLFAGALPVLPLGVVVPPVHLPFPEGPETLGDGVQRGFQMGPAALDLGGSSSLVAGVHAGACAPPGAVHAIDPVPDGPGRIGSRVWRPRIRLCTTADRIGGGRGRALRMREPSGAICDIQMADLTVPLGL